MASHPFHPRFTPFVVYVVFISLCGLVLEHRPLAYPWVYSLGCVIVGWLLWRYRGLMPEITLRFHWIAVPVGVVAAGAWMGLGAAMEIAAPDWFAYDVDSFFETMGGPAGWFAMIVRLLGMALLVPIFEEVVFRSALSRSLYRPRTAAIAFVQLLEDLPVVGEWVMRTNVSKRFNEYRRPLAEAFERVPLGRVSVFNLVFANIVLWCLLSHRPRDWPGTAACGLLYVFVLWYTNRPAKDRESTAEGGRAASVRLGLGPVIWAHGITNALLWGYTLWTDDWRFL